MQRNAEQHNTSPQTKDRQILSFVIENQRYGLPIEQIAEIVPAPKLHRLPGQSPAHLGVAKVRNTAFSVIDIHALSDDTSGQQKQGLLIILAPVEKNQSLRCDRVEDIHHLSSSACANAPVTMRNTLITEIVTSEGTSFPLLDTKNILRALSCQRIKEKKNHE